MGIRDIFKKNKSFCPGCGQKTEASARYCLHCGLALPERPGAAQQPSAHHSSRSLPSPGQPFTSPSPSPSPPSSRPSPRGGALAGFPGPAPPRQAISMAMPAGNREPLPPRAFSSAPLPFHEADGFGGVGQDVPRAVYIPDAASGVPASGYGEEWDGETTVLDMPEDHEDETTILSDAYTPPAFLVREDTGERIPITKQQFVLGRSQESSDYWVEGKHAISRKHAAIVREGGRYLVVDMNSSNRTYLDEIEVSPGQGAELFSGSRIRLADMDFTFYIG